MTQQPLDVRGESIGLRRAGGGRVRSRTRGGAPPRFGVSAGPAQTSPAGNGEIEAAVKQLTGIIRTNKLDLERSLGKEIPLGHPVMTWLVEYAAWMLTVRTIGPDGLVAYERVRGKAFHKRFVRFGELVNVHLPVDGPDRANRGALDARAVEGVMLGYGTMSHSYFVWMPHLRQVKLMRSIYRLPESQRWSAEKVGDIDVTVKDQTALRGARTVPLTDREPEGAGPKEPELLRRAARRLELRQSDFDPAMGGHGWTEHCPKCDRARLHGWRSSKHSQHSAACRSRLEEALSQTKRGQERLEHTQQRFARRRAAHEAPLGKATSWLSPTLAPAPGQTALLRRQGSLRRSLRRTRAPRNPSKTTAKRAIPIWALRRTREAMSLHLQDQCSTC